MAGEREPAGSQHVRDEVGDAEEQPGHHAAPKDGREVSASQPASRAVLAGGGEMGRRIRAFDWSKTLIGPLETWPQTLRTVVGIMLGAGPPLAVYWGPDLILLYNDAWRTLIGDKHPGALGKPARDVFPEIWETVGPMLEHVLSGQGAQKAQGHRLPRDRRGPIEDAWFDYSFNPIPRGDGAVGGVLNVATEVTEQMLAQEELREAERKHAELIRHAPAGIYEIDFRENRFVSVNDAISQMLGYSHEELLAMDPFDLLDAEGQELFQSRVAKWLAGQEPDRNVEFRVKTRSGDIIDAVLDVTFTADEDGKPLGAAVVAHDVTERKRRERRISRYNRVLRGINRIFEQVIRAETEEALGKTCLAVAIEVSGSRIGFIGEVGADGRLQDIAISAASWDQFRVGDQSEHGRPAVELLLRRLYDRVVDDGESLITNNPPTYPDSIGDPRGHPALRSFLAVPLTHEGRTIGVLAVANRERGYSHEQQEDLETLAPAVVQALLRKRAEERLRESEALYRTLAANLPGGAAFIVDRDLRYMLAEGQAVAAAGFAPDDFEGRTLWEALDAETAGEYEPFFRRALGGEVFHYEHDSHGRHYASEGVPIRDPSGKVTHALVVSYDITGRKRTEKALERSRQRLAWVLDKTGVGTWLNELPLGRLNWDDQTKKLFFVPPDAEATIELFWSRLHPDDREPTRLAVDRAIAEETLYAIDHRVVNPETGQERWIRSIGQATYAPDGTPTQFDGISFDITERKEAEEALRGYAGRLRFLHEVDEAILAARSAEEVAQSVVERLPQLLPCQRASVVLHDPDTKELSLLAFHSEVATRLGRGWRGPADEAWDMMSETLREGRTYVVEDLQAAGASSHMMQLLSAEGIRAQIHEPIIIGEQLAGTLSLGMDEPGSPSSEQVDVLRDLAVQLAVGLEQARLQDEVKRYTDELEQLVRRRTAALEVSEARFRTIFEGAAVGIALADTDGDLMATNPAFQRMMGYSEDELAGRCLFDLIVDTDGEVPRLFQQLVAGEQMENTQELTYVRKGGKTGQANVTVSLLDRDDASPLVLGLMEDITERKRAQEALIQAERLTIMGRMAASLAHEVNNPLQAVVGCLGLAVEALDEGQDARELMDVALQELKRAARIVHRMRDVTRREEGRRELTDLGELIDRVLTLTHKQAENNDVRVVWKRTEDLPLVPIVPDRVQQVFLNIVLNAIDAMPYGGRLRIWTELTERPEGVRISFADTGPGIPPEGLKRLFEAFQSDKEEGLGLGLYVSRNIVQEHDGRIDVESRLGHGATFTVWLPR
jgi:PAS domain S-box-containing protein